MSQKGTRFYEEARLRLVVRFLERRLNRSRRLVPGTLCERFVKVQTELARRGRNLDLYNLLVILDLSYFYSSKELSKKLGMSVETVKQTRRRLWRVKEELRALGELPAE